MSTLIKCEIKKLKGRYFFVMMLAFIVLELAWILQGFGKPTQADLKFGWELLLYQSPLANSIFLPFVCSVTASRLCEPEHKGGMLKQLCTMTSRGKLFDAKLLVGLLSVSTAVFIIWICTIFTGKVKGFWGDIPVFLYIKYLIFTLLPTAEIYILQHTLSLCIKNQFAGFFAGIAGGFMGVFSMFLPSVKLLRQLLIWGHYGALDFMGLYGWTKETKFEYVYFKVEYISPFFILFVVLLTIGLYILGRYIFERKEL